MGVDAGSSWICGRANHRQYWLFRAVAGLGVSADVVGSTNGHPGWNGTERLSVVNRLCELRRGQARDESHYLDACDHSDSQWPGHHPVFHFAATTAQELPAMR